MVKRKFRFYVEEAGNDGSEYQLIFTIDDKIKDIQTEYCIRDCLTESDEFVNKNCEKYNFDSRFDGMEITLNFKIGM